VSPEERDEREALEKDVDEDLELEDEAAENVRGGRAKSADKAQKAMDDYLRG
jgi:hypothetical protein